MTPTSQAGMAQKVLFDVDPGCDDAVMLAMALGLDALDVVGISTVCGNSTTDNTTQNTLAILELGGYDVPVARGVDRPLEDELSTAEWVHGEGGIRGDLPTPERSPVAAHGVDFIIDQAHEHGEALTIAAVGPLPNLAIALAKEPRLPDIVGDIYLMGGAATTVGNATPMAEANFHNDPVAANRVVQDAHPVHVGLDVTNRATIPLDRIETYQDAAGVLGVVGDWLRYPDAVLAFGDGGAAIHDAAVVADIADSSVLATEEYYCEVDTSGGPSHGATVCDVYGVLDAAPNTSVAVDIDVDRFRELVYTGVEAFADEAAMG